MSFWKSISTLFPVRDARSTQAGLRLTQAYQAVFRGKPSEDDQHLVLADLSAKSGFYRVSREDVSSDALRQREGMRALYAHIFAYLSLNPDDVMALENAARREAAVDDLNI